MAVPDGAAARLATPVLVAGITAALALLAWNALAAETAERAVFIPLLIGMFFLGLPHGALDHLVPARMGAAWGRRPASLTLFLGGHAGLAAVYLQLWTVASGNLRGPALRLARDLTLITLLALAFLVALTAWAGPRIEGLGGFVALYLVWNNALTMPHLALVAWLDHGAGRRRSHARC